MGRKHTPETKAKIAAVQRGHRLSPESRAKISAARRGTKASPETRAKMAAAHRKRYEDPAERAKTARAVTGRRHSEETKAKIGAASRRAKHVYLKGDDIGYVGAHARAKKRLPRECAHADESCNGRLDTALKHDAPSEGLKVSPTTGLRYSPRPEDYMRLCHSHHQRYDNSARRGEL